MHLSFLPSHPGIFHFLPVSRVSLWPQSPAPLVLSEGLFLLPPPSSALFHSHLLWLVLLLCESEPQLSSYTWKPPSHFLVCLHSETLGMYCACYLEAKGISYFLSLILCQSDHWSLGSAPGFLCKEFLLSSFTSMVLCLEPTLHDLQSLKLAEAWSIWVLATVCVKEMWPRSGQFITNFEGDLTELPDKAPPQH